MARLFGTDGIRGVANADLSCELALDVGRGLAEACRDGVLGDAVARPTVVVGRDPRLSGPMLEAAVVAGLTSAGASVEKVGVLPTPGVAHLTSASGADAGVMLSASHNPVPDNGIKIFGPGGWKLDEDVEAALEERVGAAGDRPTGRGVGGVRGVPDARERYIDHLVEITGADLAGLRVVVDAAHGAAAGIAPTVLRRLGADVEALHDTGDGGRINEGCGATHPEVVASAAAHRGIIGLTHDGDADRVLAADERGRVIDGDQIMAILARGFRADGRLPGDALVVTVMSNQALRSWASDEGVKLSEVGVGDRNVLQRMRSDGINLGGEQSGHLIVLDAATTGDGILAGALLLAEVARGGGSLSDAVPFEPFPQVLVNVRTRGRDRLPEADGVWVAVEEAGARLGDRGRVLLRPSGTEPVVRVMVEAATEDDARSEAEALAAVVRTELGEEA